MESEQTGAGTYAIWIYNRKLCGSSSEGGGIYASVRKKKTEITIETPKGIPYTAQILDIRRTEDVVSCAVQRTGETIRM